MDRADIYLDKALFAEERFDYDMPESIHPESQTEEIRMGGTSDAFGYDSTLIGEDTTTKVEFDFTGKWDMLEMDSIMFVYRSLRNFEGTTSSPILPNLIKITIGGNILYIEKYDEYYKAIHDLHSHNARSLIQWQNQFKDVTGSDGFFTLKIYHDLFRKFDLPLRLLSSFKIELQFLMSHQVDKFECLFTAKKLTPDKTALIETQKVDGQVLIPLTLYKFVAAYPPNVSYMQQYQGGKILKLDSNNVSRVIFIDENTPRTDLPVGVTLNPFGVTEYARTGTNKTNHHFQLKYTVGNIPTEPQNVSFFLTDQMRRYYMFHKATFGPGNYSYNNITFLDLEKEKNSICSSGIKRQDVGNELFLEYHTDSGTKAAIFEYKTLLAIHPDGTCVLLH